MNLQHNSFVVLTHDNKIKYSETDYLIKNNLIGFLTWHCEVFDHTTNINSQNKKVGFTACRNKSRTCAITNCTCPTDIDLPKAKSKEILEKFRNMLASGSNVDIKGYKPEDGEIVACGLYKLLINESFVVDWNLLRRCNFSCTYCAPDIHDLNSGFPSLIQYKKEFEEIEVPPNREIHFNLNGGEPTLHPNILDIVKMCKKRGTVELLSNGTASIKMYNELLEHTKINISLHHELITEKHMQKFIDIALLGKGQLVFKYFNTFDEEKFKKYLNILEQFENVSIISNKRLILRGQRNKEKTWAT